MLFSSLSILFATFLTSMFISFLLPFLLHSLHSFPFFFFFPLSLPQGCFISCPSTLPPHLFPFIDLTSPSLLPSSHSSKLIYTLWSHHHSYCLPSPPSVLLPSPFFTHYFFQWQICVLNKPATRPPPPPFSSVSPSLCS